MEDIQLFAKSLSEIKFSSCFVNEQINHSTHVDNLLDEIWKLDTLVSYVSQQRGSP